MFYKFGWVRRPRDVLLGMGVIVIEFVCICGLMTYLATDDLPTLLRVRIVALGIWLPLSTAVITSYALMDAVRAANESKEVAERVAAVDELTGLLNRRSFDARARQAVERRSQGPFSLISIDLDYFKTINDTCGHAAGDAALVMVARTLTNCVRRSDLVARMGGDEFAVLLLGADKTNAERIAGEIRRTISELTIPDLVQCISASIGVCEIEPDEPLVAALRRVDVALYDAKQNGRNRIELHPNAAKAA